MAPLRQKAIVIKEDKTVVLKEVDVPKVGPGQILVRVIAAAQNPTDWKTLKTLDKPGGLLGVDYAGVVEEVGPDVPEGLRHVGEHVCGTVHGGIGPTGAFSEYLVGSAKWGVIPTPAGWSFEDAAQIGVAGFTAIQTLWEAQKGLPTPLAPTTTPIPILVYGGSSAVGFYTIQFAKLSGLRVLVTASPRNFDLLKEYGADELFDYKDPEVSQKIKAATGGKLKHAVDTISEAGSGDIIAAAFGEDGGHISQILWYPSPKENVTVHFTLAYEIGGEDFEHPIHFKATAEHQEYCEKVGKLLADILALGKVKPMPKLILPNGLASVEEGLGYMMSGKVSAQKITYRIADTPGVSA
ncbi:GroES-like protein [Auriscalpium vulgare]|uniref:GroES-like protein n=1 Tax=Auriscalpium vulgare TaxID=40419 RepID=A0ACB8S2T2_9AGAM|nr:GroES-like protein [Auriscalpium vulgare]